MKNKNFETMTQNYKRLLQNAANEAASILNADYKGEGFDKRLLRARAFSHRMGLHLTRYHLQNNGRYAVLLDDLQGEADANKNGFDDEEVNFFAWSNEE